MSHARAFTWIELVVVLMIIALLIGILLPLIGSMHKPARGVTNSTPLRGIHQGFYSLAQDNGPTESAHYFAGLDADGRGVEPIVAGPKTYGSAGLPGSYPAARFAMLLNGGYVSPEYLVKPIELGGGKTLAVPGTDVTVSNFSYALLRLDTPGRRSEWRTTDNPRAAVGCDRLVGSIADPYSVWTGPGSRKWEGQYVTNDVIATTIPDMTVPYTRFGSGPIVTLDHLFIDETSPAEMKGNNAVMVYATNSDHENQK
jgi:hypothetical protein